MIPRRIGVLTSGGDAPGMNTAIRAVVRSASAHQIEIVGIEDGFDGLIRGTTRPLLPRDVGDILQRGGTFLQTARCDEMLTGAGRRKAIRHLNAAGLDGLIVIGGDGSLAGAEALHREGVAVVGIPASIDNDIWGTNMSIGVDTALNTIVDVVDKLRDTATSHQRAFLVETMGRNSGYLALMGGLVCGAELSLIPEVDITLEEVGAAVAAAYARGKNHAFIVVAEGAKLDVHEVAAHLSGNDIGFESRVTILGHVQRGGSPSAFDRLLASRLGVAAIDAMCDDRTGVMVGLSGREIGSVPLEEVVARSKGANLAYHEVLKTLAR
jgi:6-phosphofructokinase 1